MKRRILLVLSILLLTGCFRVDLVNENYDELVLNVIKSDNDFVNEVGCGYQFYIPKGIRLLENNDYNQVFFAFDTKLYMYVDITSYFYKNTLNYSVVDDKSDYYKEFSNGEKQGYMQIFKADDNYFLRMVYNYAKVEVYTDEYNLNNIIIYSAILLDNVDYQDNIIHKLLDDNSNLGSEITYSIEKPAGSNSGFSQMLEEYITIEDAGSVEQQLPDY